MSRRSRSLAAKIEAANAKILIDGDLDAVAKLFAADYVAHLTDEDLTGGHEAIRKIVGRYRRAFADCIPRTS